MSNGQYSYTCEDCGGTFESERSDEEANQEALSIWGREGNDPDMTIVCDDCFNAIMADLSSEPES